jgi:hypothetical protein
MRNTSDKSHRENLNTCCVFNIIFVPRKYSFVYEIMWKRLAEPDRPQNIIRCMRLACQIMWKRLAEPDRPQNIIRCMRLACRIIRQEYRHAPYDLTLIINSITKYFVAIRQGKRNPLLHFNGNSEHFYIANSYTYVYNK